MDNDSYTDDDDHSETMSWIDGEELEDEFYGSFYNSPIDSIQIIQMLFNSDCQKCLGVSRAGVQLSTPGVITPEELIPIIKCQTANGFIPFTVLRFAIELDSANLSDFAMKPIDNDSINPKKLMEEVTYTDDIRFPTSVKALESTATLFILYKRKQSKSATNKQTTSTSANGGRHHKQTRAIRIKNNNPQSQNNRKTRRKSVSFDDYTVH